MLYRVDLGCTGAERCAAIGRRDVFEVGLDFRMALEIRPAETNAGVRLGRPEAHARGRARVQANALENDFFADRLLRRCAHSSACWLPYTAFSSARSRSMSRPSLLICPCIRNVSLCGRAGLPL